MDTKKVRVLIITCLFILSGFSGIAYEVIWVRLFGFVFGNTNFASSTVLSVFMGGLALGSYLFGKYVDSRNNALRLYAFLELGIGVAGLLVPVCIYATLPLYVFIFRQFHPSFYEISLIRLVISFLILIVPCTLMGGTLPVLCKCLTEISGTNADTQAGKLYAANTLGAVGGCFISGFYFIGSIGLIGTTAIAAFCNFAIAIILLLYGGRLNAAAVINAGTIWPSAAENEHRRLFKNAQVNTVIILYAISGFLSLFLEVAWTRALVWVMGMDCYAFASMLSVFLFGLALGSFVIARFFKSVNNAILELGSIQALIGISVIASTMLIKHMYMLRTDFGYILHVETFFGFTAFLISIAAAIMLIPALLMGMAFPLALKVSLDGRKALGTGVGIVYAANTIGSVFGSLLAGFVAIPIAGVMKSIIIAGGVFLLVAAVLFMTAWQFQRKMVNAAAIIIAVGSFVFMFSYAPDLRKVLEQGLGQDEKMLYFGETYAGGVEVTESIEAGKSLKVDGLVVASDGQFDLPSHKYPAHLVSLLKEHPKRALFIGFGAGGTSGSILRYNELERLDVVEICGGVVEPARRYFTEMNYSVLDDPRLHLIIQDGKNFVRLTENTYDIVYSGPIHPQSNQGSAALYTTDFFVDCRKLLNNGGIHCLWLPLHMPLEDYKVIVKSFQQVYPYCSLWLTPNTPASISHTHLVGSNDPIVIDYMTVKEKLRRNEVLADINKMSYITLSTDYQFIGQLALGPERLREFTADVSRINTDNLPTAEFFRKLGRKTFTKLENEAQLLAELLRYKENGISYVVNLPYEDRKELEEKCAVYYKGDNLRILGHVNRLKATALMGEKKLKDDSGNEAFQYLRKAYWYYNEARNYLPPDRFFQEMFGEEKRG